MKQKVENVSFDRDSILAAISREGILLPRDGTMFQSICKTPSDFIDFVLRFVYSVDDIEYFLNNKILDFVYPDGEDFSKKNEAFLVNFEGDEPEYPDTKKVVAKVFNNPHQWIENSVPHIDDEILDVWSRDNFKVLIPEELFPIMATICFDWGLDRLGDFSAKIVHYVSMSDLEKYLIVS